MPPGIPEGAMCVQRFDDSLNSAIHITYRISLRSSSMSEPRDPLLKVLIYLSIFFRLQSSTGVRLSSADASQGGTNPSGSRLARTRRPAEATGKVDKGGSARQGLV